MTDVWNASAAVIFRVRRKEYVIFVHIHVCMLLFRKNVYAAIVLSVFNTCNCQWFVSSRCNEPFLRCGSRCDQFTGSSSYMVQQLHSVRCFIVKVVCTWCRDASRWVPVRKRMMKMTIAEVVQMSVNHNGFSQSYTYFRYWNCSNICW